MDEDLPFPVTDYNPDGHTTTALKTSLPTLYIYPNPIDIHATHVNYTCKYLESLFVYTHKKR
jgi:hypothetical protein